MLEEYGPTIKDTKVPDNYVVNSLIRLTIIHYDVTESEITRETLAEIYYFDKLDGDTSPLT